MSAQPTTGATLFQRWRGKPAEVLENLILNPLSARVGAFVRVSTLEYESLQFTLRAIYEYVREIGGKTFRFADYELLAKAPDPDGNETDIWVRLRVNPDQDAGADKTCLVLLLHDQIAYDKEFEALLNSPAGMFQIDDASGTAIYARLNGIIEPYRPRVTVLSDEDGNGQVTRDEVAKLQHTYWDYSRQATRPSGSTFEEFLFAEMDEDGMTQLWRGSEIPLSRIHLFQTN